MRAQRRPRWFALGCVAAIVYAGRASFTTQSHVRVLNNIEQLQGANATFDAPLRAYVRANEAEVRHALDTAARWRSHFTFATSMHSASSSVVESVLRRVPPLWRFVSIGLLGAFDGVPDADRRAASMQRQFFGDAQARTVDSGPLIDACRTGDRRTAAQSSVHLRTQTRLPQRVEPLGNARDLRGVRERRHVLVRRDPLQLSRARRRAGHESVPRQLGRPLQAHAVDNGAFVARRTHLHRRDEDASRSRVARVDGAANVSSARRANRQAGGNARVDRNRAVGTDDDVWTLPTMLERRHLFWNQQTSRRACVRPLDSDAKPAAVDAA
jgi:hypothetical protein